MLVVGVSIYVILILVLRCRSFSKKKKKKKLKKALVSSYKNYYYFWKSNIPVTNLIVDSRKIIKVSKNMT